MTKTKARRKFTAVTNVSVSPFEDIRRGFNTMTINYRQRCTYTLECGHMVHEDTWVGSQPKTRIMCKQCAAAPRGIP